MVPASREENLPAKVLNRKWQAYAVVRIETPEINEADARASHGGAFMATSKRYRPASKTIKYRGQNNERWSVAARVSACRILAVVFEPDF